MNTKSAAITVEALSHSNNRQTVIFENGLQFDFAAPGVRVLSTRKGGGTTTLSGTSMAAPHFCGLLLFGAPGSDGTANGDPDGDPDPIAHF